MLRALWRVLRAFIRTMLVIVLIAVLLPPAVLGIGAGILLFSPVPVTIPQPRPAPPAQPSYIYDIYDRQIAVFKSFESKVDVPPADIPLVLKQAVISAEDRNFYKHHGIDLRGTTRALVRDLQSKSAQQGGSTITQQLVKNVYARNDQVRAEEAAREAQAARAASGAEPVSAADATVAAAEPGSSSRTLGRKLREAIIANRLDRTTPKEEILHQYLSNIYLGQGAYGVGAASLTYFRKPVRDLTLSEAATLAGIIPAPSAYEPRTNPQRAEVKRQAVLRAMLEERYITPIQFEQAIAQRVWVETQGPPPGPVTLVFAPKQVETVYPYFVDYVRRYLLARYGEEKLYRGGLQVYTTIDPVLQTKAEAAVSRALKGTKAPLEMSLVAVEPLTGYVKALVGGRDFNAPDGQVNLALGNCPTEPELEKRLGRAPQLAPACWKNSSVDGGGSGRSPGSSIKPIVLAEAFRQGIPPSRVYSGAPFLPPACNGKVTRTCRPIRNYEGAAYGAVDLRTATIKSVNTVYARLGVEVGIENVAKMAQRLGITSAWYDRKTHGPSYALGGIDVSPLEMAAAYSVFAGRGKRAPATPVLLVIDRDGNVLEDNTGDHTVQVIPQNVADNVTSVLQGVIDGGTGTRAQLDRPAAGKTGTSQGYGNAWFVGYTPNLSTSVWIGYKDRPRPLRGIKGFAQVAGGTIPARTWGDFMNDALKGLPPTAFDEPAPIKLIPRRVKVLEKQRQERQGIDPGAKRRVAKTTTQVFVNDGGIRGPVAQAPARRVYVPPVPIVVPPPATVVVTSPPPTTPEPEGPVITVPLEPPATTEPPFVAPPAPVQAAVTVPAERPGTGNPG